MLGTNLKKQYSDQTVTEFQENLEMVDKFEIISTLIVLKMLTIQTDNLISEKHIWKFVQHSISFLPI